MLGVGNAKALQMIRGFANLLLAEVSKRTRVILQRPACPSMARCTSHGPQNLMEFREPYRFLWDCYDESTQSWGILVPWLICTALESRNFILAARGSWMHSGLLRFGRAASG